ncbi:desmethyl-deoxy-podophyllotoxin synthase-like isoform X2 [Triticum urartu]|uniref:desmethyl-deoxy-podophyllotoxin synthase-like isoform X2 n=1 Tax=Triticum urartu TaxID=4572 RepID=UPI002044C212|nr:desmethyl-deoxy-podophyllotoxin synthase-like isoform X2 [Triticum urartu]
MEGWLSLSFLALLTLLVIWLVKLSVGKSKPARKQLPPGPWTLPIIGSLHHVAGALPHRTLMQLSRRHGQLMHLMLGEVPAVVVSSPEAAALVMKTNDLVFAGRPRGVTLDIFSSGGRGIAFAPYGDHLRQMRKVCVMELLSSTQVKRMEGIRAEEVGSLLRDITAAASTGHTINVSEKVMALSNDVVTRAVFGGKFSQQGEYLCELDKAFKLLGGFCLVDLFPSSRLVRWLSNGERQMKKSCGRMQRIISEIIDERKSARAAGVGVSGTDDEDLLDVLLRLQKDDSLEFPLTTETVCAVLFVSISLNFRICLQVPRRPHQLLWRGLCQSLGGVLKSWLRHNKKYGRFLVKADLSLLITTSVNSTTCRWSSRKPLGCIHQFL